MGSFHLPQPAWRTDEIRRTPPTPQDEMRAGMSYFHETIFHGLPRFLKRIDTALSSIGIKERLPLETQIFKFSSWMGGDRDGESFPCRFQIVGQRLFCRSVSPLQHMIHLRTTASACLQKAFQAFYHTLFLDVLSYNAKCSAQGTPASHLR